MDIKKMNFIVTQDIDSRTALLSHGFTEVPSMNKDIFVFVNEPKKLNFDYDNLKIVFTNKLTF